MITITDPGVNHCTCMMCEVKNYMFPEIKIGQCIEFNSSHIVSWN